MNGFLNVLKQKAQQAFLGNSLAAGIFSWAFPGEWNRRELLEQYIRSGVVYAVVSAIAEEAAKVKFKVMKGEIEQKKHPLIELLKKPNPKQSQFQFLEMHFTFMEVSGESFWYLVKGQKTGDIKEVYLLRPDLVTVEIDENDPRGLVKEYKFNKINGKEETFQPEEILHFKMPNPLDMDAGLAPTQAGKDYIESEVYGTKWTKNSLFNSGRPSGVVTLKGAISDDQFNKFKRQFQDKYTGVKNAGKLAFFKGSDGVDFEKLGMDLSEVALKDLSELTRNNVMLTWRLSKTMLGISDDVNRANAEENHAVFIENIIEHKVDRTADHLTAFLLPLMGSEGMVVDYESMSVATQKDKESIAKTGTETQTLTVNEKREVLGYDPIDGMDYIPAPFNLSPLKTQEEFDEAEERRQEMEDQFAAQNNGESGGGVDPEKDKNKEDDKEEDDSKKGLKKKELGEARIKLFRDLFWNNQEIWELKFEEEMKHEFRLQEKEILAQNPVKGFKGYSKTKSVFPEWMFAVGVSKGRLEGAFTPLVIALMKESAKFALDLAGDEDTELEITEAINQDIIKRVNRFADSANDVTIKAIEKTITEGVKNSESIKELRDRIKGVYKEASDTRALMIARTETINASNQGALEAYRQSPIVTGKEWSVEANACGFCASMKGKILGLEEHFLAEGDVIDLGEKVGKLTAGFGNIDTPPLHPNCRCSLLPVVFA